MSIRTSKTRHAKKSRPTDYSKDIDKKIKEFKEKQKIDLPLTKKDSQ